MALPWWNHRQGFLIGADQPSGGERLRELSSRFPNPTNAQAIAALDGLSQSVDADTAIASGMREDVARAFLHPDGIFPRMRLLAWGWEKPGDKLQGSGNAEWWRKRYQYPLWNPIETYIYAVESGGGFADITWDDDLARGSSALLSYALPNVVQYDLPPVMEAPCPRWLIPPGKRQLPVPNPECARRDVVDRVSPVVDKLRPQPTSFPWWLVLVGVALVKGKRR